MIPQPTGVLTAGFIILPLLVAAMFVVACAWTADANTRASVVTRASVGVVGWLVVSALLACSGILARFDILPPPFAIVVLGVFAIGFGVAFSRLGTRLARALPLWALVGFQAFRLPLELLMHNAASERLMPVQMSYSGYNFDIVTGTTAAVLGLWLYFGRAPRGVVVLWNMLGSILLATIVTIAMLSTPVVRAFGDDRLNTFVAYFPFVWLPAVLVTAALLGHLLLWRRLASRSLGEAAQR